MNPNTAGRTLALHLAAAEDHAQAHDLIQQHIDTYTHEEALHIFAVALEALAAHIVHPAIAQAEDPAEYRRMYTQAAMNLIAGPTEEE